jgi:hypothetical protein
LDSIHFEGYDVIWIGEIKLHPHWWHIVSMQCLITESWYLFIMSYPIAFPCRGNEKNLDCFPAALHKTVQHEVTQEKGYITADC